MTYKAQNVIIILPKGNREKAQKGGRMEDMREFVSYCRKLLRVLEKIEKLLESGKIGEALELVRELKEDTQKDIEA